MTPAETPLPVEMILLLEQIQESPVSAEQIKTWTSRDVLLSQVLGYVLSGWPDTCDNDVLKPFYSRRMELSTQAGCLLWGNRVIVPPPGRQLILDELHAGHPGVSRMKSLARTHVCLCGGQDWTLMWRIG